jgi:hypothetical protein
LILVRPLVPFALHQAEAVPKLEYGGVDSLGFFMVALKQVQPTVLVVYVFVRLYERFELLAAFATVASRTNTRGFIRWTDRFLHSAS